MSKDHYRPHDWNRIAKEYDPIKIGSIDGTDVIPHDKAIIRALYSKYVPNKNIKGKPRRTLFVGRLNPRTVKETLMEKFTPFGNIVSCHLICDIVTGISKRYAFIEYDSSKSALKAFERMNEQYIDDYQILVDYEVERTMPGWKPRRLGGGFGGRKGSGQLRFGCRVRPFQKPIVINTNRFDHKSHESRKPFHKSDNANLY